MSTDKRRCDHNAASETYPTSPIDVIQTDTAETLSPQREDIASATHPYQAPVANPSAPRPSNPPVTPLLPSRPRKCNRDATKVVVSLLWCENNCTFARFSRRKLLTSIATSSAAWVLLRRSSTADDWSSGGTGFR
jgi:hypothetical protein